VLDVKTSAPGKHGHTKCRFLGVDIFTGSKHDDLCVGSHNIDVPVVKKVDLSVTHVSGAPSLHHY